jgi:hypothetical protein
LVFYWIVISLQLIFQLTVRSLTTQTIADDPARVARLKVLYDRLDSGTTPASVLFPWFPSPALLKKLWATREIYNIVVDAIDRRERGLDSGADTLQMLLDNGDDKMAVVGVSITSYSGFFPISCFGIFSN